MKMTKVSLEMTSMMTVIMTVARIQEMTAVMKMTMEMTAIMMIVLERGWK